MMDLLAFYPQQGSSDITSPNEKSGAIKLPIGYKRINKQNYLKISPFLKLEELGYHFQDLSSFVFHPDFDYFISCWIEYQYNILISKEPLCRPKVLAWLESSSRHLVSVIDYYSSLSSTTISKTNGNEKEQESKWDELESSTFHVCWAFKRLLNRMQITYKLIVMIDNGRCLNQTPQMVMVPLYKDILNQGLGQQQLQQRQIGAFITSLEELSPTLPHLSYHSSAASSSFSTPMQTPFILDSNTNTATYSSFRSYSCPEVMPYLNDSYSNMISYVHPISVMLPQMSSTSSTISHMNCFQPANLTAANPSFYSSFFYPEGPIQEVVEEEQGPREDMNFLTTTLIDTNRHPYCQDIYSRVKDRRSINQHQEGKIVVIEGKNEEGGDEEEDDDGDNNDHTNDRDYQISESTASEEEREEEDSHSSIQKKEPIKKERYNQQHQQQQDHHTNTTIMTTTALARKKNITNTDNNAASISTIRYRQQQRQQRRRGRTATSYDTETTKYLKRVFFTVYSQRDKLTKEQRKEVQQHTQLQPRNITYWFSNHKRRFQQSLELYKRVLAESKGVIQNYDDYLNWRRKQGLPEEDYHII
ncbi:hypothetical protein BJ944DRAFT_270023 [Cunninghamella echinulata]|nr:hypothetical protein BJ944DRAFT_270023 [Cunninghamella echinulata]